MDRHWEDCLYKKNWSQDDSLVFIEQNKVNFNFSLFYNFIKKVYNKEKNLETINNLYYYLKVTFFICHVLHNFK